MKKAFDLLNGVLALVILTIYVLVGLWLQVNLNATLPSDLDIYLRAGESILQDKSAYYPFEIGLSYIYPPSALLIFAPLSFLPADFVKLLWAAVGTIMYLGTLTALWVVLKPTIRPRWIIWGVGALMLYDPFLETLVAGQVNGIVLFGLALFVLGIVHDRYRWIGDIGLAIAIMVKITPVMLLAIPILQLDWKRLLRIGSGMGVLAVASWLFFGLVPWIEFLDIFGMLFQDYYYLTTMLGQFTSSDTITLIGRIGSAIILASWGSILLWQSIISLDLSWNDLRPSKALDLLRRKPKLVWAEHPQFVISIIAWSVTVMTLSSSLLWYHHFIFMVLPLTVLLLGTQEQPSTLPVMLSSIAALLIQAARAAEFRAIGAWFLYAGGLFLLVAMGVRAVRIFRRLERA